MSNHVMELAQAFVGHQGLSFTEVMQVFEDSASIEADGSKTIHLEVLEKRMKLPENFFLTATGRIDAPDELTTSQGGILI